jgi:hypothetical protein
MIFGISGYARCGKDTFGNSLAKNLRKYGIDAKTKALADSLKDKIADFCRSQFHISVYTQKTEAKNIIRPLMVGFGKSKRIQDPDYWIKECESSFESNVFNIITDIRYENEAAWILRNNGFLLNLERTLPDGSFIKAPNEEELLNAPKVQQMASFNLVWKTIEDENLIDEIIESFIVSVLKDQIELWKATFPL